MGKTFVKLVVDGEGIQKTFFRKLYSYPDDLLFITFVALKKTSDYAKGRNYLNASFTLPLTINIIIRNYPFVRALIPSHIFATAGLSEMFLIVRHLFRIQWYSYTSYTIVELTKLHKAPFCT